MPNDLANSRWRAAIHESAHACMCYASGGLVGGIRIHHGLHDCDTQLPPSDDLKHLLISNALIDVAGIVGERLYCGARRHEDAQHDMAEFGRRIKDAWSGGWAVSTAKLAFSEIAEGVLRANEKMLFRLATRVKAREHLFAEDVRSNLAESKRLFGLVTSPFVRADWEGYLEQRLHEWLGRERLAIREATRLKRMEEDQRRRGGE